MRYRSGGGALGVERKDAMIARVFVNSLTQSAGSFQRSGPSHPEPRPPPLLLAGIYFPKGCGACASAISCRSDITLDLRGADYLLILLRECRPKSELLLANCARSIETRRQIHAWSQSSCRWRDTRCIASLWAIVRGVGPVSSSPLLHVFAAPRCPHRSIPTRHPAVPPIRCTWRETSIE